MSPWSNRKPTLVQRSTLIKHVISMSYKLEPAIWSCDTGQRITWFNRCKLIITCHLSKKHTVYQGCMSLSTYYLEHGCHVVWLHRHRCRHCAHSWAILLAMITMRKPVHGFPLLAMGMGLHLAAFSRQSSAMIAINQKDVIPAGEKSCLSGGLGTFSASWTWWTSSLKPARFKRKSDKPHSGTSFKI